MTAKHVIINDKALNLVVNVWQNYFFMWCYHNKQVDALQRFDHVASIFVSFSLNKPTQYVNVYILYICYFWTLILNKNKMLR